MGKTESTEMIHRETFFWSTVLLPFSSVRRYSESLITYSCARRQDCRAATVCSFVFCVCFPAQQQCSEVAFWRVSLKNLLIKWLLNFAEAARGKKILWNCSSSFSDILEEINWEFCKQVLLFYKLSQKIAQHFESSCGGGVTININGVIVWNAYTGFHTIVFLLVLLFYYFTWYTLPN